MLEIYFGMITMRTAEKEGRRKRIEDSVSVIGSPRIERSSRGGGATGDPERER